jgi:hypothetical protein
MNLVVTSAVNPKCWSTFNGIRDIIAQKTDIFITTDVETSNPIVTFKGVGVTNNNGFWI